MRISFLRVLILSYGLILGTLGCWADGSADVDARVAKIDQSLESMQKQVAFLQKMGGKNAAAADALLAKIEVLKAEKSKLLPEDLNSFRQQRIKLRRGLENRITEVFLLLKDPARGPLSDQEKRAAVSKFKQLRKAYLTLSMDLLLSDTDRYPEDRFRAEALEAGRSAEVFKRAALDAANMLETKAGDPASAASRKASAEAGYRVARLRLEAVSTAQLTLKVAGAHEDFKDYTGNLIKAIAASDPNNYLAPKDGRERSVHQWFLELKREVDLEEFRQIAVHGPVFDGDRLVTGKTRQEIAYFTELALAAEVKRNASTMPISRLFWPTDSRIELAQQLEAYVNSNPDHIMFGYLVAGVEPSPKMYLLAIMQTLRHEQNQINTWLVDAYNTKHWWDTGLGTVFRAADAPGTSDASFSEVKRRIQQYQKQVDIVFNLLKRATETPEPGDLSLDDRVRLLAFGYVTKQVDGSFRYSIPDKANIAQLTSSAQRGLKLPGAPVLDIITPKNVAITAISTIVPGYAATAVEAGALRIGMSQGAVRFATFFTEFSAGVAIDAGFQYLEKGKADAGEILVESLLLGGLMEVFNKGAILGADRVIQSQLFSSLEQYKRGSQLRKLMTDSKIKNQAADWVGDMLGLGSEAAITTLYEAKFKGGEVDFDTFMANVLNGAITLRINKSFAKFQDRALKDWDPDKYVDEATRMLKGDADMQWLERHLDDKSLSREIFLLSREQAKLNSDAMERYKEVVGEGEPRADRVFKGLLRGEMSWMDLTIAYQNDTENMEALMYRVKDLRDGFFHRIKHDALRYAYKEFKNELDYEIQVIAKKYGNTDEGRRKLEEATERFHHDLRYMYEKIIIPGSDSPVSDIDRSMQHPKLRKIMVEMYEIRVRAENDGAHVPTAARAFDVNEYYNVMPFISESNQIRGILDPVKLDNGLTHGDMMESMGHAAAMMHMNEMQQVRYIEGERKSLLDLLKAQGLDRKSERYMEDLRRFDRLIQLAKADLARGNHELRAMIKKLSLDPSDPETILRARDALYQERIHVFFEKRKQLDRMKADDPDRAKLHAEVELEMAYMLREGIETYSGSSTLDIVVSQMQIAKLKMGPALLDENFSLTGSLSNLKPKDIDFMLRDQCLMMVEHINGYYEGHELPYNAGKALAKYAQRGLLALKIKGAIDLNALIASGDISNPALRLYRITERLMAQKPYPKAFKEVLSELTPHGNPDAGIVKLMEVIEQVLPGMKGMHELDNFTHLSRIKPGPTEANPYGRRGYFQTHRFRAQRVDAVVMQQVAEYGGGLSLAWYCQSRLDEAAQDLADVKARYERYENMGREYSPIDWPKVLQLERAIHGLDLIIQNVAGQPQPEWGKRIVQPKQRMTKELDTLRRQRELDSDPTDDPLYKRLWMQMKYLEVTIEELQAALVDAKALAQQEAALDQIDLSGVWKFESGAHRGKVKIEQLGRQIKMWFSSDMLSAKAPHFYAEGDVSRGRITAVWEELHSPRLKFTSRYATTPEALNESGMLTARVAVDGDAIAFDGRCTELIRSESGGWIWSGLGLVPAGSGVSAPTNLKVLAVREQPVSPAKNATHSAPGKPRDGMAGLWVTQWRADGTEASAAYELYSVGTYGTPAEYKVASGVTSRLLEVVPGAYEVVNRLSQRTVRQPVTLSPGQVRTLSLESQGSLKFEVLDYRGRSFSDHNYRLRVLQDGKPVNWCDTGRLTHLNAGTYEVLIYLHDEQVTTTPSYRKEFTLQPNVETTVSMRLGGLQLSLLGIDGELFSERSIYTAKFLNVDGSFGGTESSYANDLVHILPGGYEVSVRLGASSRSGWRETVAIKPAELYETSVQVGRVLVQLNNKDLPNGEEYRLILNHMGSEEVLGSIYTFPSVVLFPGKYTGQLFKRGAVISKSVNFVVKSGEDVRVSF